MRKSREDRGARRVVSAKIKAAIEGLALERPPLPFRSICRQVRVLDPMRREAAVVLEEIRLEDERRRREIMDRPGCSPCDRPAVDPTYFETYKRYQAKERAVLDPTTLILVDEADRLQMNSLKQ